MGILNDFEWLTVNRAFKSPSRLTLNTHGHSSKTLSTQPSYKIINSSNRNSSFWTLKWHPKLREMDPNRIEFTQLPC